MPKPTPRQRFWTYMAAIFALAFLVVAILRVVKIVEDHQDPAAGQAQSADQAAPNSSGVRP